MAISGEPVQEIPGELLQEISGEPVQESNSASSEEAAGLGGGPAAPAVGQQYPFRTKQVILESTKRYLEPKATNCFQLEKPKLKLR